ncbi:tetrapyrrole biosynthesis, uroporphyrinogen III synthase [Byssothecium circinans]|uniref:Tetrapyrrole biosynthesis, uroporphyrinogen III synthase n=1 Tax=Byssothecium circinans TaxID=147558 RepID=A0A6A5TAI4_9PLEO|nr:tetrapyrrole biosynthesis, uroporphyrinogen III synthase [Byssothecium circinans]
MAEHTVAARKTPVLLLKTKSAPTDPYEEYFAAFDNNQYTPLFVPVLEHRFKQDALHEVQQHIVDGAFTTTPTRPQPKYGALIFTSQRAVEAFAHVVQEVRKDGAGHLESVLPPSVPFYVVGPATARSLKALDLQCSVLGEETGNGGALSSYILDHYDNIYPGVSKPAILFLVGEKRRDIIPKTLQSPDLPPERRARVDELVIYETGEMQSFEANFTSIWRRNVAETKTRQWVVVFSPTGCQAMLASLGLLDPETGQSTWQSSKTSDRDVLIATIGPTTRDYLIQEFDVAPDVCAEKPTPEGLVEATRASVHNHDSSDDEVAPGTKRKADTTSPRRERKVAKKQTTIDESFGEDATEDAEMKGGPAEMEAKDERSKTKEELGTAENTNGSGKPEQNNERTVQTSSQREKKLPSSILEKGLIYFFARNRVSVEEAESVGDLQRTYFVLRPLPLGAKLGEGALPDLKNNRLFALPKKVFPKSHNDRFMAFVEKTQTSIQDLKDNFLKGDEYETKTAGTRHVEPATPLAEGVYAITRTEDTSTHLAYAVTIPSDLGEVQKDLGLRPQGSFIISVKNPERPGPASTHLPQGPGFPKEIIQEFRNLAWAKVKPEYLDYANVQVLLIGEKLDSGTEPTTKDRKHRKEEPKEELEQLEQENELRVEHLHGDDSVFDDLRLSKDEFSKIPTTW